MRGKKQIKMITALAAMSLMMTINPLAGEWNQVDQQWQYLQDNGEKVTNSWYQTESGKWYHFDQNSKMRTGWYLDHANHWYYLDADGAMATGWRQINEKWYYLNLLSGELLVNTTTPDGYKVDGNGAWTGGTSITRSGGGSSRGSSGSGGSGGNLNPDDGNNGNENPGDGGTETENPWLNRQPINLDQTGIVTVSGVSYAVVSFNTDAQDREGFQYQIAGTDVTEAVTAVKTSGDIVKIPVPDVAVRSLVIKSAGWTVATLQMDTLGSSSIAETAVAETNFAPVNHAPYLILTKETMSLTQYLKFIKLGETIFTKPSRTTVNSIQTRSVDALSSATSSPPLNLEGIEEEANVVVLFDMVVNQTIASEVGRAGATTAAFLDKWDSLEKIKALNGDLSQSQDIYEMGSANWHSVGELPRYVKYLTELANYGTKIDFRTGLTDNTNPPQLTIEPSIKGHDAIIELSEENETWYRSITEIKVPYNGVNSFYYQGNNTLSEDGKKITLGVVGDGVSGPMNYAGQYEITFHSYEYEDVTGQLVIINDAPGFVPTWDDVTTKLRLRADFSYYSDLVESITVNGQQITRGEFTTDINSLYIPYRYLVNGSNTIGIQARGYVNASIQLESPASFVTPKRSPLLTVNEVLEGEASPIVISFQLPPEGSEEAQWLSELELSHVTLSNRYSVINNISLEKDDDRIVILASDTALSIYNDYTLKISVPNYDIVSATFTPLKMAPAISDEWLTSNFNLRLQSTLASYLSSSVTKVVVNGNQLIKGLGADYTVSYADGINIFAHNFRAGEAYTIQLYATGYAVKTITGVAPANLLQPLETPALTMINVPRGEEVVVTAIGDYSEWLNRVNAVTVIDAYGNANDSSFTKSINGLILDSARFTSTGNYTIIISAEGYRNTQTAVKILNTATIVTAINYDENRLELTASDSYFFNNIHITVNGSELASGSDYTTNGYRIIYIPSAFLTEAENHLILNNSDYVQIELSVDQYEAPQVAPTLTLESAFNGEYSILLNAEGADENWWAALEQSHIVVKRSSTNQTINDVSVNGEDSIMINLANSLSYSSDYTVTIAVPGYKTSKIVVKPNQHTPELTDEWLENGDLKISTDASGYFSNSYSAVYLDGERLENNNDYSLNTYYPLPYSITIFASNFTAGEHTIEIVYTGTANYETYQVVINVPESFQEPLLIETQELSVEIVAQPLPEMITDLDEADEITEELIIEESVQEDDLATDSADQKDELDLDVAVDLTDEAEDNLDLDEVIEAEEEAAEEGVAAENEVADDFIDKDSMIDEDDFTNDQENVKLID